MDHVDLTPYPFPPGMDIPRLMPFQLFPFNGDGYLAAEVLRLKEAHGLTHAIETGMCLGSTTIWLSKNFAKVMTCEVNEDFANIAHQRLGDAYNVAMFIQPSATVTGMRYGDMPNNRTGYYLDAHWGPNCPLLDELTAIAKAGVKPCIVIHDFQVPGTDFGFDSMPDGRPFNLDLIRFHLDVIYGEGKWRHNYPTKVEGARRGWISIEPA